MRILFLCPSLEAGRDGVGDYTRRLAEELVKQGHECALVALNDRHLPLGEQELTQQAGLQLLRLSAGLAWGRRMKCVRQFLQDYQPDWVSLQFGPFAYHPKGLSARLERDIRSLADDCHLHVMCHELWIDPAFPLPLRHRFLGWLQQSFVQRLFSGLRPILVHTQLEHYQRMLSRISVSSQLLPLHGNVPVTSSEAQGRHWLAGSIDLKDDDSVAGFFGDILPTLDNTLLEQFVIKRNRNAGRTFILSAGGLSEDGKARFHKAKIRIGNNACFVELGRISEIEVSKYLASLDAGLTAYPVELAAKSGGVAAMLEHGKSVLCLGRLSRSRQHSESERTIPPERGRTVSETATRFVGALTRAWKEPS
jgi:hypothetical protein